jgi:putative ABC transport system permease protein
MMLWRDLIGNAVWGLTARPARTGALVACLAAGVTAAVFVGVVISGFSREIDRLAFGAYSQALVIQENGLVLDRYGPPTLDDLRELTRRLPQVRRSAAWISGAVQIYRDGETHQFRIYGTIGDYELELDTPVVHGRGLTATELESGTRACLLGAEVALVQGGSRAIGRSIRLNGVDCRVVGILGEPNSRPASVYADGVIAPFVAAHRYFINEDRLGPDETDRLTLFVPDPRELKTLPFEADRLLRKRYGVPQSRPSPFIYGDRNLSLEQMVEQRRTLSRLLVTVASLSILTSILGFSALSAANITARQREIAIRLALGGDAADIQRQLLMESACIGLGGGLLGAALGLALGLTASTIWTWPFALNWSVVISAAILGPIAGVVSGGLVTSRASRLSPSLAARG